MSVAAADTNLESTFTKDDKKNQVIKEMVARRKSVSKYHQAGYYEYKGVPACGFATPIYRMEAASNYDNFKPDDLFILTYPKAGTHFCADVVQCIYMESLGMDKHNATEPFPMNQTMFELQPFSVPEDPLADLEASASPRQIASHLRWAHLPADVRNGKVKTIHVTRNPVDSLCSAYPFLKKMGAVTPECTFDEYLNYFIDGTVPFGGYFDWMRDVYPHQNDKNMLTLCYEDMREDLASSIRKICKFLEITLSVEQIDTIVEENKFENKKKAATGKQKVFLRQGSVGGWRQELSLEQTEKVKSWIDQGLKDMPDLIVKFK